MTQNVVKYNTTRNYPFQAPVQAVIQEYFEKNSKFNKNLHTVCIYSNMHNMCDDLPLALSS
jgi:hypothetical protein